MGFQGLGDGKLISDHECLGFVSGYFHGFVDLMKESTGSYRSLYLCMSECMFLWECALACVEARG